MSETNRVQRWREEKRQQGLKAVTIWLTAEEELRLKDLALQWHCSPSALVQHALAQFSAQTPPSSSAATDTLPIRELIRAELGALQPELSTLQVEVTAIQAELAAMQAGQAPVTETVTEAVTATLARDLPALVRQLVEGLALEALGLPVTDTNGDVTDTGPPGEARAVLEERASPRPVPRGKLVPELSEDLVKIAEVRRQHPDISERAFTELLFDRGIYRHRAKNGSEGPMPHSTLRGWLKRAREAGLL
jgi:hypothetical protein